MNNHDCQFEEELLERRKLILEMHGDLKTLVAEFKAMNGSLRETKHKIDKHEDESQAFRRQVTILWTGFHGFKWFALVFFGTGLIWKLLDFIK